jgi:hypothetical protein
VKLSTWLLPIVPACLTFGSIFMAIGQPNRALVGALMLSTGLALLFVRVMSLEKEIDKLRTQAKG